MKRRDFLRTAGGATAAATAASAASSSAAASGGVGAIQDEDGDASEGDGGGEGDDGSGGNESEGGGLPGAGETQEIMVGTEEAALEFAPDSVTIQPGTTVNFVWGTDGHNVVVDSQPDDAEWEGYEPIENTGFEYSHTFEVEGTYDYFCQPHLNNGMEGTIEVSEDAGGGGGGYEPPDPAHMGIPVQKHFIGAMAFMGIFVTLVFTFYLLKYGESAHTAAPGKRD